MFLDVLQALRNIQVGGWAALSNILVTAQFFLRRRRIISFWCYADIQQRSNERLFVFPQTRSSSFHGVEKTFCLDGMKRVKNIRTYGWAVHPQTRPSFIHGVEKSFCLDVLQPCKNIQVYGWAALSNIPCHGPACFAALKKYFVLMLSRFSKTFNWTAGRATPNTVQLISRCSRLFSSGWYEAFQKHSSLWLGRASPDTAQFGSRCWRINLFGCFAAKKIHSSLWLGRAPQHPQSRPSSFRGVEAPFRFDVTWIFNNVQMNGRSCSPKHGPDLFTVLKNLFVSMVISWSKTLKSLAESCFPVHGPIIFTVLKDFFVWIICSHLNTFKLMTGPRSPTSPVTVQLILQRRKIISFWCCADFQPRSNESMVVLP